MRFQIVLLGLLACGGGGQYGPKPGTGNPLPSGASAGAMCKPEQCTGPAPAVEPCANGAARPAGYCATDVNNICEWHLSACP